MFKVKKIEKKHFIKEIHSVWCCDDSWTYDELYKDYEYVNVDLTYECDGVVKRKTECWRKDCFEKFKEQGYFMDTIYIKEEL